MNAQHLEVRVVFQPQDKKVFVLPGTSLLEAASRAGLVAGRDMMRTAARDQRDREEHHMTRDASECYDRIRYTMSDDGGELRFTSFQITGGSRCQGVEQELKEYLLSRPLRDLDADRIMQVSCPGGRQCIETVARVVAEQQGFFAGEEEETSDA